MNLSQKDLGKFNRDGFLLVKGLFSKDEVSKLRERIDALKKTGEENYTLKNGSYNFKGDLLSKGFSDVFFDERILNISKQLLNSPKLVYFGESTAQTGVRAGRGFHRDSADREDPHAPDWKTSEISLIKMGLYLQDHKKYGGGLKVRKGSHLIDDFIIDPNNPNVKHQEQGKGKNYNIPSQAGDLMVWSMRLAHSANFLRLRLLHNICLSPKIESRIEKYLPGFVQSKLPYERKTLWISLGAPSSELDRYIKYYVERGDFVDHWKRSAYNDELVKLASANNVEIRKPIPEYGTNF